MDFNIDIRRKQLESLDQFLSSSKNKLQSVLNSLGWSVEEIEKEKEFVLCPYDTGHKVPVQSIVKHIEKCKIKHAGYDLEEAFLSEPGNQPQESSITLNNAQKIGILSQAIMQTPFFQPAWNGQDPNPQTYSRLMTTFSKDERLTLYNHCVSNTKGPSELPEFDISVPLKHETNEDRGNSEKALMSFERDIKRRSVKYKPIHINQKNYKDVLREVINSQMLQYTDWLTESKTLIGPRTPEESFDEQTEPASLSLESVDRPHSSLSKISNHSGSRRKRERTPDRSYAYNNRRYSRRDDVSTYSRHRFVNKYKNNHEDEDSQDSRSTSHDGSTFHRTEIRSDDYYENSSKSHSRDSSGHSSYKYKDEYTRYKNNDRKYRSRSPSHHRHRSRSRQRRNSHDSKHRSRRENYTNSN